MDLPDIIPINPIADMLNIPKEYSWLIFFIILFIGYISLKYFKKTYKKPHTNLNTIDEIFLISLFGLIFLLKSFFLVFWFIGILLSFSLTYNILSLIAGLIIFIVFFILFISVTIFEIKKITKQKLNLTKVKSIGLFLFSIFIC